MVEISFLYNILTILHLLVHNAPPKPPLTSPYLPLPPRTCLIPQAVLISDSSAYNNVNMIEQLSAHHVKGFTVLAQH